MTPVAFSPDRWDDPYSLDLVKPEFCMLLINWNVHSFLCSSIPSTHVHSVPDVFLVWGSAVNKAGHVSPLMEPPDVQERQNQQQQQRQCKGKCSKVVMSLEKSGKGIESGVGGEWYFILGRATAESGPCKTYRGGPGGGWPLVLHTQYPALEAGSLCVQV